MRMGGGRGGIINNLLGAKERERSAFTCDESYHRTNARRQTAGGAVVMERKGARCIRLLSEFLIVRLALFAFNASFIRTERNVPTEIYSELSSARLKTVVGVLTGKALRDGKLFFSRLFRARR